MFLTFERKDNRFFKPISEDFGMLCKTQIKTDCSDLQSSCSHSLFTIEHKQCIKCIRNTLAHFEFDGSTKKKKVGTWATKVWKSKTPGGTFGSSLGYLTRGQ